MREEDHQVDHKIYFDKNKENNSIIEIKNIEPNVSKKMEPNVSEKIEQIESSKIEPNASAKIEQTARNRTTFNHNLKAYLKIYQ